jgi:hypothetical protein
VLQRGHTLILCTAAHVLLLAAFLCVLLQRSQHSDPLACLLLRFLVVPLQCTVLQRVSTLILWHSAMLLCASCSVRCSALVCRRGQHSDPLAQLPMLLCASCSVPLQCTVLQRSQHSDPLAQLPCLLRFGCSVPCSALCCRGQHSDPLAPGLLRFLQRSLGALCCRGQHSDPQQLLMLRLRCCVPLRCTVLQRVSTPDLALPVCCLLAASFAVHCVYRGGQHS